MNEQAPTPAPSITPPLLVWILLQLLGISLAAFRYPLTAGLGTNIERLALDELLAIQLIASGMLFPFLLRTWSSTIGIISTSLPYLMLAELLCGAPGRIVFFAFLYVAIWIVGLQLWNLALPPHLKNVAIACTNLLTIGLPLLSYLHAEFSPAASWRRHLSPVVAGCAQLHQLNLNPILWLPILLPLALALIINCRRWWLNARGGAISHA